jgi:pyruvate dehydrogenase E2 component (dihydrolipoamide acetyltransferase)
VATENGLLVPVIKEVDKKTIRQISKESKELIDKARKGKLLPNDLSGGTFTVSNLGMYDIEFFTPIINNPEVAILGVGRIKVKPLVLNGEIEIRSVMSLSLSFDHRVIDGVPAATFLKDVKFLLENPFQLIAEV